MSNPEFLARLKPLLSQDRTLKLPDQPGFGLFEPEDIGPINMKNLSAVSMPPSLSDLFARNPKPPVPWREIRAAFHAQLKGLYTQEVLQDLYAAMKACVFRVAATHTDLTWIFETTQSEPLIPLLVRPHRPKDLARLKTDQAEKLRFVLAEGDVRHDPIWVRWKRALAEIGATQAVVNTLKARQKGDHHVQSDLVDAILPFQDRLDLRQMAYAVTTVLTAIAGAPGALAACTVFELHRHPHWKAKITAELQAQSLASLCAAPTRQAPLTHKFLKEVLRLWAFPIMVQRQVHVPLTIKGCPVHPGETYSLSAHITHRDARYFPDPDRFDPDRWGPDRWDHPSSLPDNLYVPFGWAPTQCLGAALGLAQLFLLCRLVCVDAEIKVTAPGHMRLDGIAIPTHFHGQIRPVKAVAPPPASSPELLLNP